MTGHEIRSKFLNFFVQRGHRAVPSSSLVPANDPTLLFTNAGMNQFKDVFLGLEKRDYVRACSSQKCVRAGGKHNDLENVGYTRRHHTFFEMLGNFSFGDYFKAEAIDFAWELVTKDFGLSKDRLYVTIFREDDDAGVLWQKVAGVPSDRIFRLDEKDNFWQMGETGPCGPCSEIHYDLGPHAAEPGREHEQFPSDAGGRFVEIWNLVFMQFDRDTTGKLTPLPRPSIDTGMGLERVAAILQGKLSNYETDLIAPIVSRAAELLGVSEGVDAATDAALRIAADHSRAATFLIHDGVVPSNEGRGYVLRKILRRAMRHARRTGAEEPFLYKLTGFVADLMKPAYAELLDSVQRVARIVKDEEHRYATTFQVAERFFHEEAKNATGGILPGSAAFKLYDTYGLALDEQQEMAREYGLAIDEAGFERSMEEQRARARASWKGAEKAHIAEVYQQLQAERRTEFLGYQKLESEGTVTALVGAQQRVEKLAAGVEAELVLDRTPFYAEAGGQIGDRGALYNASGEKVANVIDTYAPVPGLSVHRVETAAEIRTGDHLRGQVDPSRRASTMRNHTATHLLHAALRDVLGTHVKQAGSVVEPSRLRFDFTHYTAMDAEEIAEVERLMNEQILSNKGVNTNIMELDQALTTGAMALFGEKYGDRVRVVSVEGFSKELCGGTHVSRTGDIGLCKITYEGSISAGVRRIEAITGEGALRRFQETSDTLNRVVHALRASEPELVDHVEKVITHQKNLERQVDQLKTRLAQSQVGELDQQARMLKGVKVLAGRVDGMDRPQLRALADALRNLWKTGVVVLASSEDSNIALVSAVTKDLTGKVHAGKLAGQVAKAVGGKGGGRPDLAEAGGKDVSALSAALEEVYSSVEGHAVNRLDVAVVGAGPTGLACGIELKKRGLSEIIFDKGCVVNSLYNYPTNMVFFTTPELLEIGDIPMTSLNEKPNRTEALKYYRRVAAFYDLNIHQYEHVESVDGTDGAYTLRTIDRNGCPHSYSVRKVILATGYYDRPNMLNVPGEELEKVIHYYKEPHPYYNHDVAVIGAKNSAAIAALELYWTGARVTLIHRGPAISDSVKYWIKPNIENRIKNQEVKGYFNSSVVAIRPCEIDVETPDGLVTLKNDFVFAMVGYRPDIEFLAAHGITFQRETDRPYTDPQSLESERKGIYLAGVLVAGMQTNEIFIENGRFHGRQIAEAIAETLRPQLP